MLTSITCNFNTIPSVLCLLTIITLAYSHQKIINQVGYQTIQGQINKMLPIDFGPSIQMIHSASTSLTEDLKYIIVHPATVYPSFLGYLDNHNIMLPSQSKTLVEQLRTYQTSHYKEMVIFEDYVFLHMLPNKIVVVETNISGMTLGKRHPVVDRIQNIYTLDGLTSRNQTKMYKIRNGNNVEALLTTGSQVIYKIGRKQSTIMKLDQAILISHIQFIDDNVFIAAQRGLGLGIYKIQSDRITKLKRYSCEDLINTSKKVENKSKQQIKIQPQISIKLLCFISDVSFNETDKKIYFLDSISGLYESDISISDSSLSNISLITDIPNCEAIDMVSSNHIVLVCQIGMPNSYIQQLIRMPDPLKPGQMMHIKKQPIFHQCSFNDLIVTQDFFLVFDDFNIEVFWNSKKSTGNQFSTQHTKQQFNFPGLEIFALKRSNKTKELQLYVVQSNTLMLLNLNIFNGKVYVYSPIPISKQIKVQVPGMCDESTYPPLTHNREFNRKYECFYEKTVLIDIKENFQPVTREKVSMSIGAIILMLSVLLIIIWICLAKYRGLERHAKKILQKYRQTSRYNDNKFNL